MAWSHRSFRKLICSAPFDTRRTRFGQARHWRRAMIPTEAWMDPTIIRIANGNGSEPTCIQCTPQGSSWCTGEHAAPRCCHAHSACQNPAASRSSWTPKLAHVFPVLFDPWASHIYQASDCSNQNDHSRVGFCLGHLMVEVILIVMMMMLALMTAWSGHW